MTVFWIILSNAARFTAIFLVCVISYRYFDLLQQCIAETSTPSRLTERLWCPALVLLPFPPPPGEAGWIEAHELVALVIASIVTLAWALVDRRRESKNSRRSD
jgi:hypothetical protein